MLWNLRRQCCWDCNSFAPTLLCDKRSVKNFVPTVMKLQLTTN